MNVVAVRMMADEAPFERLVVDIGLQDFEEQPLVPELLFYRGDVDDFIHDPLRILGKNCH